MGRKKIVPSYEWLRATPVVADGATERVSAVTRTVSIQPVDWLEKLGNRFDGREYVVYHAPARREYGDAATEERRGAEIIHRGRVSR